jgi:hypothetical protein
MHKRGIEIYASFFMNYLDTEHIRLFAFISIVSSKYSLLLLIPKCIFMYK